MSTTKTSRPVSRGDFEVAIICALSLERDAVEALLDEDYEEDGHLYDKAVGDNNAYTIGRMGKQHVVVAQMPGMGTVNAAAVAANLKSSFPEIRVALVVGICGGIPAKGNGGDSDMCLGDVIVSTSIVQIDFGRHFPQGFKRKKDVEDVLGRANPEVRAFVGKLSGYRSRARLEDKIFDFANQVSQLRGFATAAYPGPQYDIAYPVDHRHKHWNSDCKVCNDCVSDDDEVCDLALESDCGSLGCQGTVATTTMEARRPVIHFGRMASGNQVIKNGRLRDRMAAQEKVIGVEMESAGTWDYVPTIVVKGVCDYADSHKNNRWQKYAATTAAACSKAILEGWRSVDRKDQGTTITLVLMDRTLLTQIDHTFGSLSQPTFPVHTTVTRMFNKLFTGRHDVLNDLKSIIQGAVENGFQHGPCHIVISGLGGQGKSEICLQLAHQLRSLFWGLFWIDVSTTTLATNGYLEIAGHLGVKVPTWEVARQQLANEKQPWFLVLDNADDPEFDYQPYFPASSSGVVVLTSRNAECERYASDRWISLEGLAHLDACNLLLRALNVPDHQRESFEADVQDIARLLHSHPLALIQASAYIGQGHCSLKEYPRVYEQQRKRLLKFRPKQAGSRYRDVYATFEASAETLRLAGTTTASDALQLLSLLSMYGSSQLPIVLFEAAWQGAQLVHPTGEADRDLTNATRWHLQRLPLFLQHETEMWDSFRLVEALNLLKALSLVATHADHRSGFLSASMHPLVHAWARERLDSEQQHVSWVQAGCIMALPDFRSNLWFSHERELQSHLQAVVSWPVSVMFGSEPVRSICRILLHCGYVLAKTPDERTLSLLTDRIRTHLGLNYLSVDPEWLDLYDLTARNMLTSASPEDALEILEQVAGIRGQTLSEDDPVRLSSQHHLAVAYVKNRRVKEAIELFEQVVGTRERTLDEHHSGRLASQHELANAYLADGQAERAIQLLKQVTKAEEQVLAEEHPERLLSLHTLAEAYSRNGQVDEALILFQQVIEVEARLMAEDHPKRLATEHNLGYAYFLNGQVERAIQLLEQVCQIQERVLPEDHPSRLGVEHTLATAYLSSGQTDLAVQLFERVCQIQGRLLSEDHPEQLASQHELARAYAACGQVEDAVILLKKVVEIKARTLPESHPRLLISQEVLATYIWKLGDGKVAMDMMRQVVDLQRQSLRADDPDRLRCDDFLAQMHAQLPQ